MEEEENYYVGIDVGTSNTVASIYMNGKVKITPNKMGERITPSVVLFEKNKTLVGEEALCESNINDKNFIYEVKRFIGLTYDEFENLGFDKSIKYIIKNIEEKPQIEIEYNGKKTYYTAEDITTFIIKKIMQSTEKFIEDITKKEGTKINSAVFTVPAQFSNSQKYSLVNAAKRAGINNPKIINEPTAAALAYGFGHNLISKEKDKKKNDAIYNSIIEEKDYDVAPTILEFVREKEKIKKLMVIDLGGGTYDISVINLKLNNNTSDFEVICSEGDIHLGGSDFDNLLYDYCIDCFCKNKYDKKDLLENIDNKSKRILKLKCENIKKMFGIKTEAKISIENFYQNEDLYIILTNINFKQICKPIYERIENKIKEVLNELRLNVNDIYYVILVGGGSKIYGIRNSLEKIFGKNKIKDDINPEEAVAIGASLYAVKSQGKGNMNFNLQDIIPYDIGVGVKSKIKGEGEVLDVLIRKYTKFPSKMKVPRAYKVNLDKNHPFIVAKIFEGNIKKSKYTKDMKKIGNFIVKDLNKIGNFEYTLFFEIDINGKLIGELNCEALGIKKLKYKSKNDISKALVVEKTIKIAKNNNLSTAASIISDISDKKKIIKKSQDFHVKLQNLDFCSKAYEEIIKNYIPFIKYNPNSYEKLFSYTKELFNLYIEILELRILNEEKIYNEIIIKIKEYMKNLINEPDYVEELFKVFIKIKNGFCDEYYQIFVNYMELLNNKGKELSSKKSYNRYYVKLYFEKVFFSCKKYINKEDLCKININIKDRYDNQLKIRDEGLKKINSYAHYVETIVKEGKYIPGNSGYTWIEEKLKQLKENPTEENILEMLELFHDMADSFAHNIFSIEEGFCLANIIVINFENLKIKEYDILGEYIEKFKIIMEKNKVNKNLPIYTRTMEIIHIIENNSK